MSSDRYHKAAKDGLLDLLKEANRREVNAKDADGMTPVLWAAFEGKLDALRLLVGRGGDPDKSDQFGNTALHLAAAKGHLLCVDFLVKFGVNLYSLDIDRHTAKDLASINNRDNILRYLDVATANLEQTDRKKSKSHKEQAEKQCEKRIKEYAKRQQKIEQQQQIEMDVKPMPHRPSTVLAEWKHRLWSTSQGNLKPQSSKEPAATNGTISNGTKFSSLIGATGTLSSAPRGGPVQRKAQAIRAKLQAAQSMHQQQPQQMDEFKIAEIDSNGKRSVRSLHGVRRDSEVIYVGTYSTNGDAGKRGKIADVFDVNGRSSVDGSSDGGQMNNEIPETYGTMFRSISQPNFFSGQNNDGDEDDDDDNSNHGHVASEEVQMQRPSGLFDRPMLGSLAFRRSITATLSEFQPGDTSSLGGDSSDMSTMKQSKPIQPRSQLIISDSDSDRSCDSDVDDQDDEVGNPLERFLNAWGLGEHIHIFQKQQIDLDTLLLLTESDLKSLGLPLGPFRKLVVAIQERKNALTNPGPINDSRL